MLQRVWNAFARISLLRVVVIIGLLAALGLFALFGKNWVIGVAVFPLYYLYWRSNAAKRAGNSAVANSVRFFVGLALIELTVLIIVYCGQQGSETPSP